MSEETNPASNSNEPAGGAQPQADPPSTPTEPVKPPVDEEKHLKKVEKLRERKAKEKSKATTKAVVATSIGLLVAGIALIAAFNMPHQTIGQQHNDTTQQGQTDSGPSSVDLPSWHLNKHVAQMPEYFKDLAGWVGGAALVFGGGLFLYSRFTRRKYIQFDKIGLLISDSPKAGEGDARFIPWGCLQCVEVVYPAIKASDVSDATFAEMARKQLASADQQIVFYVDDGSTVRLNWGDLIACTEAGSFINALKTWAPDAVGASKFPGEEDLHKLDKNNYTQLWFKYYSQGSDRKRTSQLVQGETLQEGRYTIAGRLGSGGQGTAYLAADSQSAGASDVVLKEYILPVHRGQQVLEQTVEKLRKEADILRKIDHPNIVRMLTEFVEDHRGYLVMEYVSGRSLKALVAQEGKLPEKTVLDLGLQICGILEYLHNMHPPVIHRDLTPDNLILQDDGIVKLVDFNVAHQLESQATATVVGKHCYIPPEQFRGKPTTGSDLYAFGCTMFYLLTAEEPEPLTVSRPRDKHEAVSEELNYVVATCTSMDPAKRFSAAAEVKRVLQEIHSPPDKGAKVSLNQGQKIEA